MTAAEQADAAAFLTEQFKVQKSVLEKQFQSVLKALEVVGVEPIQITSADPTAVQFRDDQKIWQTTLSQTEIVIGALFLRGLVLGSLREAISGKADFSQSLASYLGAKSGSELSASDLEFRARLFFAAARKGVSVIRTDEDFRDHFKTAVALMNDYLDGTGNEGAARTSLEKRLESAAAGGEISGADGMAMFDVFMRLSSHFEPAKLFVLSHELGHVVLGHAPFSPNLSCSEKKKREDDADAFALALLVYDVAGDTEVSDLTLRKVVHAQMKRSSEDNKLAYGYAHAIRYGFALAGLSNQIDAKCNYRDAEDRVTFLDGMREKLVTRRSAAIEELFRFFRARPPYVYTSEDVDAFGASKRRQLERRLFRRCNSDTASSAGRLRKLDDLPFGWVVQCPNDLPHMFTHQEFILRAGSWTSREFSEDYKRHVPVSALFDDTTIKALLM